jgi:ADP-heptose:LPS heptosyltransferase
MKKVLICRTGALGDVCMTLPVVDALARHCDVHWLIGRPHAPLLQLFPQVRCDLVIADGAEPARDERLVSELNAAGFDALLDFSNWDSIARLVSRLKSIPLRATAYDRTRSYTLPRLRNALPWCKPFNHIVDIQGCVHRTVKWQQLIEKTLGCRPSMDWPLPPVREPQRPIRLFIHSHASKSSKRWPVERFAAALVDIGRDIDMRCFINEGVSSEKEASMSLARLLSSMKIESAVVPIDSTFVTLRETLRQVDFALGLDSGPMHVASLLGVPTIVIYGPYRPEEVAPLWRTVAIASSVRGATAEDIGPAEVSKALAAFLRR